MVCLDEGVCVGVLCWYSSMGIQQNKLISKKNLKQGDPLAHFLFLLVTKGLGSLTKAGVEFLFLNGFKVWGIGGGSCWKY